MRRSTPNASRRARALLASGCWLATAVGLAASSWADAQTYAIDTVLDWRMQSLDREARPAYPADTAATLRLIGTVTIGKVSDTEPKQTPDDGVVQGPGQPRHPDALAQRDHTAADRAAGVWALQLPGSDREEAVTFRWSQIHYRERPARGTGLPDREWVLTDFDPQRVKDGLREAVTRWRPLLSFPQAAAYETEALGYLLAYVHGRTVHLDLQAGMWDIALAAPPSPPVPPAPAADDATAPPPAPAAGVEGPAATTPNDGRPADPNPSDTTAPDPPTPPVAEPEPMPLQGPALLAQWVRDAAPDWPGNQPFELYLGSIVPRLVSEDWGTGTFGRYRFRDYGIDPRREGFEDQAQAWSPGYGRYERDFPLHRDDAWEREVTPRVVIRVGPDGAVVGSGVVPRVGGGPLVGSGGTLGGGGVGGVGGLGGRTRLGTVVNRAGHDDPALPPAQAEAGAVYLPLAARLTGQLETHLRGLAQFARRPVSRQEALSTDIFAPRPALLVALGGDSRVGEVFRKRLLEHPAPTPAGSALAWMGWLPVDGAVVRDTRSVPPFLLDSQPRVKVDLPDDYLNLVLSQEYPDSYFLERAVDFAFGTAALKRQAGQRRDIRLLSDARRGKLTPPTDPAQQVVWAQQLREAEARQWLIANSDEPRFPVYRPADVARLNLEDLWIIQDHAVEHQAGPIPETLHDKLKLTPPPAASPPRRGQTDAEPTAPEPPAPPAPRGAYVGGYRVRSLVPSAEVLRFNATAGVPIAVPPYLEQTPRARMRIETEWVGWSWQTNP